MSLVRSVVEGLFDYVDLRAVGVLHVHLGPEGEGLLVETGLVDVVVRERRMVRTLVLVVQVEARHFEGKVRLVFVGWPRPRPRVTGCRSRPPAAAAGAAKPGLEAKVLTVVVL